MPHAQRRLNDNYAPGNKMPILRTLLLSSSLALACMTSLAKPAAQKAAPAAALSVTLNQGEVARWPGIAAKSCVLGAKKYPAVDAVCYYPFDVEAAPGRHAIALIDQDGKRHNATAIVEKVERPRVDIKLTDDAYIDVSRENQKRASLEREAVLKLFAAAIEEPQFSLPLGAPASPLPKNEDDFGSLRTFNGKVESEHTGRDYPVNEGNSVRAIAAGRVVLAEDHFLTGNSVYIDHGDGMVSASFHMSSLSVKAGDEVKRGQALRKVGSTGRTSGTHLHLGIRWLAARVDPQPLLESPLHLHEVGEKPAVAERKEDKANAEPKESNRSIRRDDEG
jgi:murein DD-endopeptidase MepM/ murein hydrolase activator NlpD